MTDDEKLTAAKKAFEKKLSSIDTWNDFKTMIDNITTAKMKSFIKNSLQNAADVHTDTATVQTSKATDLNDLANEVDIL
jgi:hypothetical protein